MALADQLSFAPLGRLHPDRENPRLPPGYTQRSERRILQYLERNYDAVVIAESIAEFGYFQTEPLVVVPRGKGHFTVVEGNRRLAALKGLASDSVRKAFRNPGRWNKLATKAKKAKSLPEQIPVIEAEEWEDAAPLIGFRHIAGIEEWKPYPKARFIARLVNEEGMTDFARIAALVGESEATVQALYRNQAVIEQGRELLGVERMDAENLFGVFTAALNRRAIREFIGVVQPSQVDPDDDPMDEGGAGNFAELLSWLYGSEDEDAVIGDSRDLGKLARVIDSPEALAELRRSRELTVADEIAGGPGARFTAQLSRAAAALEGALENVEDADEDTEAFLKRCEKALRAIRRQLKATG